LSTPRHNSRPVGRRAPRWLNLVNPINRLLLSRGIGPAPQHLLSIAGRGTGRMRTTPVALVTVDGDRYVVAGFDGSDWVKNARAAGRGQLRRGRTIEDVALTEVPVARRGPILRAFATRVRGGQPFLGVPATASAEAFTEAAPRHPVFRVYPPSSSS
jgi:deazaflavin-dependent oxidoreductase (nitroreductase family)